MSHVKTQALNVRGGQMKRRVAVFVSSVHVGTGVEQGGQLRKRVTGVGRMMHRRSTPTVSRVDVGAGREQHVDDGAQIVVASDGLMQTGGSVREPRRLKVRARREQRLHHVGIVIACGLKERRAGTVLAEASSLVVVQPYGARRETSCFEIGSRSEQG